MLRSRSVIRSRSVTLAAVCTFSSILLSASVSWAAEPLSASTVGINAVSISTDSESSQAASPTVSSPTVSSQATASIRHYHRRRAVSRRGSVRRLPSRGIVSPSERAASVVGKLALVISDKAVICAGREASGRVLSVCPKGQYLALSGETPTQYAVLMIDHSLGYVAKSDVQILAYQVVNNASDPAGDSAGGTTSADGTLGAKLVQTAFRYLGVPYVWGGNTAAGIDCSGFVKAVYEASGIALPRVSGDQAAVGYDVPRGDWSKWLPGDRMYFACHHSRIDHTGMYIGDGRFIHSSMGHGQAVAIDRVDASYYASHLVCVRRSQELLGDMTIANPVAQTASSASGDSESGQN